MKFTLVFPSHESWDVSVGLVFTPCAEWNIGGKTFFVPHRDNPFYMPGDFQELVKRLASKNLLTHEADELQEKSIFIIVHEIGHGTENCLTALEKDIIKSGMNPMLIRSTNQSTTSPGEDGDI